MLSKLRIEETDNGFIVTRVRFHRPRADGNVPKDKVEKFVFHSGEFEKMVEFIEDTYSEKLEREAGR